MNLKIKKPRDVVCRKVLAERLSAIADADSALTKPRARALALTVFKGALEQGRQEIQRRFEGQEAAGAATLRAGAYLLDQLIRTLHEFTTTRVYPQFQNQHIAIIARAGMGARKSRRNPIWM